jgi:hypothetical protein
VNPGLSPKLQQSLKATREIHPEKQAHRRGAVFRKGLFRAHSPTGWRREAYLRDEGA